MGSHFVDICSIDEHRLKGALGSKDQAILQEWLGLIRKNARSVGDDTIQAREEVAKKMIAGDFAAGEAADGAHFGYAFEELCRAWASKHEVIECYVDDAFPQLWDFVVK